MKIPLIYPKIPENKQVPLDKCIVFQKYDGTNLHWNWTLGKGWHSFGTRRTEFPLTKLGIFEFNTEHSELKDATDIFNEIFRDRLTVLLCQNISFFYKKITIFTEFLGPNSFAGSHDLYDTHELVLIDVSANDKIISPYKLQKDFIDFRLAEVIYTGKYSGKLTKDVYDGKYNVNEGVVVKGMLDEGVFMTKIKTKEYLKKIEKR